MLPPSLASPLVSARRWLVVLDLAAIIAAPADHQDIAAPAADDTPRARCSPTAEIPEKREFQQADCTHAAFFFGLLPPVT
jgi:hypothetical protein